jgi:hypothetical protein
MRRCTHPTLAVIAIAGFAVQAFGQIGAPRPKPSQAQWRLQAYTAEFKDTRVQTLANGTTITREISTTQAKDSQGRFFTATTQQRDGQASITRSHVDDPVAGTSTDWDSQGKKATVVKLPPDVQRRGCWTSPAGHQTIDYGPRSQDLPPPLVPASPSQHEKPVYEDLGTTTILGIQAQGRRSTITTPAGAVGNDQPLVITTENWMAKGYPFSLRHLRDDPRQGKEDRELVKLDQGEPDPALFQPPEGYEVVTDEMVPCKE